MFGPLLLARIAVEEPVVDTEFSRLVSFAETALEVSLRILTQNMQISISKFFPRKDLQTGVTK